MSSINSNSGRKPSDSPKIPLRSKSQETTASGSTLVSTKGSVGSSTDDKPSDHFNKETRSGGQKEASSAGAPGRPTVSQSWKTQMGKTHKQQRKEVAEVARKAGKGVAEASKKAAKTGTAVGAAVASATGAAAGVVGEGAGRVVVGGVATTAAVANFLGMPSLLKGIGALIGAAALSAHWVLNNFAGPIIGTVGHALAGMAKAVYDAPGKAISDTKERNKEIKKGLQALGFGREKFFEAVQGQPELAQKDGPLPKLDLGGQKSLHDEIFGQLKNN